MPRAAIYARYSSDRQTEDSIEAQVRACRDYAAARGYQVVEVFPMRLSAAKALRRPSAPSIKRCFGTATGACLTLF